MYHNTRYYITDLHIFLQDYSEALQNTALLLGERSALRRTQRLLEEFATQPTITRRMRAETLVLYALLSLQNVHDLDRPEAGCCALLDPSMPYVEDICRLTDQLQDAMEASGFQIEAPDLYDQTAADFLDAEFEGLI